MISSDPENVAGQACIRRRKLVYIPYEVTVALQARNPESDSVGALGL